MPDKNKAKTKSFRSKIFKIFLLVALVPLLLILISNIYLVITTRQKNISELQNLALENAKEKTLKFLSEQVEKLNLITSGTADQGYSTPSLNEADPNHLINLLKKKSGKSNRSDEKLTFYGLDGDPLARVFKGSSAAPGTEKITLKKYFPSATILTHSAVELTEALTNLEDFSAAIISANRGRDYLEPRSLGPEASPITVASQILNQKGAAIGAFVAVLNPSVRPELFAFSQKLRLKNFTGATLKDINLDVFIADIKNAIEGLGESALTQQEKIESGRPGISVEAFTVINPDQTVLAAIYADGHLDLVPYQSLDRLTKDINIVAFIPNNLDNLSWTDVMAGNTSVAPLACRTCLEPTCAKCEDDKYIIRVLLPLKNENGDIIGAGLVELNPWPVNDYILTIKLGNATNDLGEIDPNYLAYFLQGMQKNAPAALRISYINKDGEVIARLFENSTIQVKAPPTTAIIVPETSAVDYIDENMSGQPFFMAALYGGTFIASTTAFSPNAKNKNETVQTMLLATQIENENRDRIGVVAADINLKEIEDNIIAPIKLGREGYVYLIDSAGRVIASANKNFAAAGDYLGDVPLVHSVMNGQSYNGLNKYTTYLNRRGANVIFAAAPLSAASSEQSVGWYALSEWPRGDAFSVINDILRLSVFIALGTIVLILTLGFFFSQKIVRPIKALSHAAKEITKGNLDYHVKMKTDDEFEILRQKFNDMVKVLKDNRRLRDEFVFISAHELRTPVTAIKGYLSMILDNTFGPVPENLKNTLDIVNASNERLVQLVHDLLEIARSEAGKMKITLSPVQIYDNVKMTIAELRSLSDKKGIVLKYDESFRDIKIMADAAKLKEVLVNIIGNAIKYTTSQGGVEIWHELKGSTLFTYIKDHGIGMTPEEAGKLFEKFYRVQNDDTKNIEGTGLGLFITKEIIERMNGKISVSSEKGKGSTFSFYLQIAP